MLRSIPIAAAILLLAQPVLASGKKQEAKDPVGGQYIEMSIVALPVIADGRLLNYVFVHARINLTAAANVPKVREKEPFFRDALVRAAHRTPLTMAGDYNKLDAAKVKAVLAREAAAITGPGIVRSVELSSQAPLRQVWRPAA